MGGGNEGWMRGCAREREGRTGCERGERRTDGNEKYSKLGKSQTKTGERERAENIARVGQREGCMLRLMDGWRMGSTEKVERNKRKGRKKKPVNLCLVNLSILPAGSLSPAAETI